MIPWSLNAGRYGANVSGAVNWAACTRCLCRAFGSTADSDEVVRGAVEYAAERSEDFQVQPLRGLRDEPEDLLAGERYSCISERFDQIGSLEHSALGHERAQLPVDVSAAHEVFPCSEK